MVNKFQAMFRGQQVIIEYEIYNKEIDYAVISNDNPHFIHPDYENFSNYLDEFHEEVLGITNNHLKKIQ